MLCVVPLKFHRVNVILLNAKDMCIMIKVRNMKQVPAAHDMFSMLSHAKVIKTPGYISVGRGISSFCQSPRSVNRKHNGLYDSVDAQFLCFQSRHLWEM